MSVPSANPLKPPARVKIPRQHPLPWVLLGLSWLAFACLWFWLR